MPRNTGLKLFTKTWPLKREKKNKEEDRKRPLTATLEKPSVLDIRFIGKIDMSKLRKEFMNISNLCRLPLVVKKKGSAGNRPLSLLSAETYKATKKKRKKGDPSDDSHEDEESSVISIGKVNRLNSRSRSSGRSGSNRSVINQFKQPSIQAIKNSINDANNNRGLKVPTRKPTLSTIPALSCPDPDKSTKLPSPCRTCGRPDLPERFHSHPATQLKLKSVELVVPKVPAVKSSVQKPIAIKYKSKTNRQPSPLKKPTSALPVPVQPKTGQKSPVKTPSPKSEPEMERKSVTPQRTGSGKRTLTCYICGREFGTASLGLHEPKCLQRWERENSALPPNLRRKPPAKPEEGISQQEWNQLAWESSQSSLVPCTNCGRTFYPDRLEVHQRSCKKKTSNESLSSMSQSSDPVSSTKSTPPSVECYICGRMFGTHSIKIHEKQCLKKWHVENETLPFDMRSPAPTRPGKTTSCPIADNADDRSSLSSKSSPKPTKDERPASAVRSPLFPCYLCGKLFTVNSIYIHEPQCLKMWKVENDKLPASKRRPVPLKPDVKFTRAVNTLFNVSICIGAALSGVLYEAIGFYGVFSSAIAMYTIALTYCILRVRDPKTPTAAEVVKSKGFFRDFFQTNHIKETFKTAIKKGARGRRTRVCAIIFLYVVIVGPLYGELAVVYFYGRLRFGWDSIQYSMFTTFQFVTGTVGTVFSLSLFSQYLKLDDSILGMISCCTKVLSCLVYAFAPSNLYFYIGSLAELLNGTSFIAMRAMISKLVPPEELGKINSLFGVFEALVPMVYGPMYSRIYAMTINTFPGSFYIVGGALTMPAVFIFYWLYLQHKKDLVEEEKERLQHEKLLQYSKTG